MPSGSGRAFACAASHPQVDVGLRRGCTGYRPERYSTVQREAQVEAVRKAVRRAGTVDGDGTELNTKNQYPKQKMHAQATGHLYLPAPATPCASAITLCNIQQVQICMHILLVCTQ